MLLCWTVTGELKRHNLEPKISAFLFNTTVETRALPSNALTYITRKLCYRQDDGALRAV